MKRIQRLSARAALLLCALALAACPTSDSRVPRSAGTPVILISIDTLRADHLSLHGYERPTSPNLDRLAGEGVVFESFMHSGGGTLPSHMSMMTSLQPSTHGVNVNNGRTLAESRVTLAEALREAGYVTAGFVDGGWMRGHFGFSQGFDFYDDSAGHLEKILPKAEAWLEEQRSDQLFLFLHTYDVHSEWKTLPYDCPGDYAGRYADELRVDFDGCRGELCASKLLAEVNKAIEGGARLDDSFSGEELDFMVALYDGCINYVDDMLAGFFAKLDSMGLYDPALIVVTSDHGEEFGEHGMLLHHQGGFEEMIHIPLILKLPGGALAGQRTDRLAAMVDLMPTVLELVGLEAPAAAQGRSLVPTIRRGERARTATHVFSVLRTERYKFVSSSGSLFDLEHDPAELINIAADHPDLAERMRIEVETLLAEDKKRAAELATLDEGGVLELTPEERRNLEALGYLN